MVTTADTHVIGPRRREAEAPPPAAVEDSSLDGTAQGGARAMLRGGTSPGAALSAARRATLSGDTSREAHMRRAASIPARRQPRTVVDAPWIRKFHARGNPGNPRSAVSQSVITTLLPTEHMAHCTLDLLGAAGSLD